jgi:hypothetical protein
VKPILQGFVAVCVIGLPIGSFLGRQLHRLGRDHARRLQDRADLRRIGR